jgi:hypothetical protein
VGETRVDLEHLLEDIRDAYPGSLEETIVTEIVANALDSGARSVRIETDPTCASFTLIDDGSGMTRRELARYHDIAASTKSRGEGIGFAGVGIKLGILASTEVYTETRRGKSHVATSWRLASRHKAPWRWTPPLGLVPTHGTAVRLVLRNPLAPLLESGFVESVLTRHFQPLLDPVFDALLADHYPGAVRFEVNGRTLPRAVAAAERTVLSIRLGRRRKPAAVGWLVHAPVPLPTEQQGIAVSTLGKVIKRGWDWLGLSPVHAERATGLFEVPGLAECLTLNKADFIRAGARGAVYLGFRKALQETIAAQLAAWGDTPPRGDEEARRKKTRPFERDLSAVLAEMADAFPLIASLVEKRAGGQARLPLGARGKASASGASAGTAWLEGSGVVHSAEGAHTTTAATGGADGADGTTEGSEGRESPAAAPEPGGPREGQPAAPATHHAPGLEWPTAGARRKPVRLGLTLQFESRPEDSALGRLVDTTVWVNEAHPAYRRAAATRAEGYHLALTVALSLAPLAVEAKDTHAFVTAFLARWGEALERPAARARKPRRRP